MSVCICNFPSTSGRGPRHSSIWLLGRAARLCAPRAQGTSFGDPSVPAARKRAQGSDIPGSPLWGQRPEGTWVVSWREGGQEATSVASWGWEWRERHQPLLLAADGMCGSARSCAWGGSDQALGEVSLLWGWPNTGTGFPVRCLVPHSRGSWRTLSVVCLDVWAAPQSGTWTLLFSSLPTKIRCARLV